MYVNHTKKQRGIERLRHYAALTRITRPAGIWLLLWPCWWGVGLATPGAPDATQLLLFALGAACMRSAGCIVNDMADRRIDAQVTRTRARPLASGALGMADATLLLCLLLALALLIVLHIHPGLLPYAAGSLLLVAAYPFMKRITFWPQAFLGLTFNLGALLGWIAVTGEPGWPAVALYLAGICWTIGYDTIYAHQDIEDDLRIGVKSTAIRFGAYNRFWIALFYALTLSGWLLTAWLAGASALTLAGIGLGGAHLCWQAIRFRPRDGQRALRLFTSNQWVGLWIALLFLLDGWMI